MVAGKLDLQKRQHRERSQPLKRQRLGLLEKHADYVKRARDFHSKEDRIKKMREKAAMKNKDEFYFGMIRSRTSKGVHIQSRGNEALPTDLVKVLKTQDAGYIRTQRAIEESRVRRLQEQLDSLIDSAPSIAGSSAVEAPDADDDDDWDSFDSAPVPVAGPSSGRKHVLFSSDLSTILSSDPLALLRPKKRLTANTTSATPTSRPSKRARKSSLAASGASTPAELAQEEEDRKAAADANKASLMTELAARKERLMALSRALRELEVQRLLMGKGAKKALVAKKGASRSNEDDDEEGGNAGLPEPEEGIKTGARVWKWKSERKR